MLETALKALCERGLNAPVGELSQRLDTRTDPLCTLYHFLGGGGWYTNELSKLRSIGVLYLDYLSAICHGEENTLFLAAHLEACEEAWTTHRWHLAWALWAHLHTPRDLGGPS